MLALLLLAAAMLGVMATRVPLAAGAIDDDGIYLVTARSLAEGRGYRHLELPGAPWQTKYPILYPFLLSLVWRASPEFPANVTAMQWLGVVLSSAVAWLTYRLARRAWGLSPWIAAASAMLLLTNPWTLDMMRMTMAEPLFTALTLASLCIATRRMDPRSEASAGKSEMRWAALAGCAAGLAYLTRSIGITLLGALVIGGLAHRRWRATSIAAIAAGAFAIAWSVWRSWAATQNAAIAGTDALGYDLDYGIQIPREIALLWQVVRHNFVTACFVMLHMLGRPSPEWTTRAIEHGTVLYVLIVACVAISAAGFASIAKGARTYTHLYVALTTALVLVWPYEPERFFYPLLPIFSIALLCGLQCVAHALTRIVLRERMPGGRRGVTFATAAGALLCAHYLQADVEMVGSPHHAALAQKREAVAQFIEQHTPPHAVIAGYQGAYYSMVTGRKFIPFVQSESPVDFFYPRDRKLGEFGKRMTPLKLRAFDELVSKRAPAYYRRAGATHVLTTQDSGGEGFAVKQWSRRQSPLRESARAGTFHLFTLAP